MHIYSSTSEKNQEQINKLPPQWQRAVDLFKIGFHITPPIFPGTKTTKASKHPCQQYKKYRDDPADDYQIRQWAKEKPDWNYGIITGKPSGIIVIEADDEEAKQLVKERCPQTMMVQVSASSKKSHHYVYKYYCPEGWSHVPTRGLITVGGKQYALDVRADLGLIVGPESYRLDTAMKYEEVVLWTKDILDSLPSFNPDWIDYLPPGRKERRSVDPAYPSVDLSTKQLLALEWIKKRPGAEEGRGADNYAYAIAVDLLWLWDMTPEEALPVMVEWGQKPDNVDQFGNHYPWSEGELWHKLEDAEGCYSGDLPKGYLLDKELPALQYQKLEQIFDNQKANMRSIKMTKNESETMYNKCFYDTETFFKVAEQEEIKNLIEPYLPMGGVNIVSGKSFSGKTVFLLWLAGHLKAGKPMLGFDTVASEVLYINGDMNNKRRLSNLLAAGLGEDRTPGFHYLTRNPDVLTAGHLEMLCEAIWTHRGDDRRIVAFLDTLRPLLFGDAQRGDDLDTIAMTQKLKPYKELTEKYNGKLTIVFVYHNARTTNEYYGSGAFMNLLDSYWNYIREEDSNVAELKIQTREDWQTLKLQYEDGQFQLKNDYLTLGQLVDKIIEKANDINISQKTMEAAFKEVAKRDNVRIAYKNLCEHGILVNCKDRRYTTLAPDWQNKYIAMKDKFGW